MLFWTVYLNLHYFIHITMFHAIYKWHRHSLIIPSKNTISYLLPTSLRLIHSFLLSIIAYTSLSFYSHITSNLVFTLSLISIINYRLVQTSLNPCLPFFIVISCVYGAYVYPVRLLTTIHRYENYITLGLYKLYCFPTVSYIAVKFIYFCDFFFLFLFIPYEGNLGGFFPCRHPVLRLSKSGEVASVVWLYHPPYTLYYLDSHSSVSIG